MVTNRVASLPLSWAKVAVAPTSACRPISSVRAPISRVPYWSSNSRPGTADSSEPGIDWAVAKAYAGSSSNSVSQVTRAYGWIRSLGW